MRVGSKAFTGMRRGGASPVHSSQKTVLLPPSTSSDFTTSLLTLPNELIQVVATTISPVSLSCLTLTCKRLYFLLSRRARSRLNFEEQKRRLLLLLEDDLPNWLLCHRCIKLFEWKRPKSKPKAKLSFQPMHHSCPRRNSGNHDPGFALCGDKNAQYFHRETRDLILRYYRKGPEYGLPLSYIEHTCHGLDSVNSAHSIKSSFKPKVVDSNLMIWRTNELDVNLKDYYLGEELYKFHDRVCSHLGPHLPAIILCQIQSIIWTLDFDNSANYEPNSSHRCTKLIHCHSCNTDIRVDLEPRPPKAVKIRVNAWHNFGGRCEYLMSEKEDALKTIRPQREIILGFKYYVRDLEQLYSGACTHAPRPASHCRSLRSLKNYETVEKWTMDGQSKGQLMIELPKGTFPVQLEMFPRPRQHEPQRLRLPWIRPPGCPFVRADSIRPLFRQMFSATLQIRERVEFRDGKKLLPEAFYRYECRLV